MVEKLVTPYIPSQFPAHYRENYPMFVEFVKLYYGWMQGEDQAIGHARRLQEYRDVDDTPQEYISYFKNKFLPFLKFVTETDKRTIIKHVLDLYRSKGTERGVDLFFKLVYGVPATVYYPSIDLFRLSDNNFVKRQYLELSHNKMNADFVGKTVIGKNSGATAFGEKYVIKKVGKTYSYVLFISNISGDFQYDEHITYNGLNTQKRLPKIVGSMNTLDVTLSGEDFSVGDVVKVYSEDGSGGLARVASTFNATGLVDFELVDGGWGYLANSKVYVSDKTLSLEAIVPDTTRNNPEIDVYNESAYFNLEQIYQPLGLIEYTVNPGSTNASTSSVESLMGMKSYYGNNALKASVEVLTVMPSNTSTAQSMIYVFSGNATINSSTVFWSPGNAFSINVTSYADKTAKGNVVGFSKSLTMQVNSVAVPFAKGQQVLQYRKIDAEDTSLSLVAQATISGTTWKGANGTLFLSNTVGVFKPGTILYMSYANGVASGQTAMVESYAGQVGVTNLVNDFIATGNNKVYTTGGSNTVANLVLLSSGHGASFKYSNTLGHAELYSLYTDFVGGKNNANTPYMNLRINATSWGFPKKLSGNVSDVIDDVLATINGNVGSIMRLTEINPGEDYNSAPFIYVCEPYVAGFNQRDYILRVSGVTGAFSLGEMIIQNTTGGKALVKSYDAFNGIIKARRISLLTDIVPSGANPTSGMKISGQSSGAAAVVEESFEDRDTNRIGADAVVTSNVVTTNGAVSTLEVLDSGFNFMQGEQATFVSEDGMRSGSAKVNLIQHGTAAGKFDNENSTLSNAKYLFDGDYWQEFSYDIRSSIAKSLFEDNYKKTMHLAGTKMFSTFTYTSMNNAKINAFLPEETANTQDF